MAKKTSLKWLHQRVHPVLSIIIIGLVIINGLLVFILQRMQDTAPHQQENQLQTSPATMIRQRLATQSPTTPNASRTPQLQIIPSVDLLSSDVVISDGNVYLVSGNQQYIFVDKQKYNDYSNVTNPKYNFIQYFLKATLSPDKSKVLLLGQGEFSSPELYYASMHDLNNMQLNKIYLSSDAVWSPNSRYIAFTSAAGDGGFRNVNLNFYDLQRGTVSSLASIYHLPIISNLTFDTVTYDQLTWLTDSSSVQVHYTAYIARENPMQPKEVGSGTLVFPLSKAY